MASFSAQTWFVRGSAAYARMLRTEYARDIDLYYERACPAEEEVYAVFAPTKFFCRLRIDAHHAAPGGLWSGYPWEVFTNCDDIRLWPDGSYMLNNRSVTLDTLPTELRLENLPLRGEDAARSIRLAWRLRRRVHTDIESIGRLRRVVQADPYNIDMQAIHRYLRHLEALA